MNEYDGEVLLREYQPFLEDIDSKLSKEEYKTGALSIIGETYSFLRDIGPRFYVEGEGLYASYRTLMFEINQFEKFYLPNDPITEIPTYDFEKERPFPKDNKDHVLILDFLVNRARQMLRGGNRINFLKGDINFSNLRAQSFEELDLANKCHKSAWFLYDVATQFGIDAKVITMEPGFMLSSPLYEGIGGHCFTIIYLDDKEYLVDCTYSQFFLKKRCIPERLGNMLSLGCAPGYFMMMTPSRRKVAEKILKDGWILLTDEVLKDYLDGFVLSDRNGLYYESTGNFSATTPYSADDYRKMFGYDTDILDYEPKETLGYQYKPLKNLRMKFDFKTEK